jgi:hypothetical protein
VQLAVIETLWRIRPRGNLRGFCGVGVVTFTTVDLHADRGSAGSAIPGDDSDREAERGDASTLDRLVPLPSVGVLEMARPTWAARGKDARP